MAGVRRRALGLAWVLNCAFVSLGSGVEREREVIRLNGQDFVLHAIQERQHVQTFEYRLALERTDDWTQQVTHQVFQLDRATAPTAFVAYLERNLSAAEPGAIVDRLSDGATSAAFRARFPAVPGAEDQAIAGLVFTDEEDARRLHVLQYALKPSRLSPGLGEAQLESWVGALLRAGRTRAADPGGSPSADLGTTSPQP